MTTSNTNPPAKTGYQQPVGQVKLAAIGIGGAGALMVLCCLLGPLLIAGGVLGAIVGNPLVIAAAVILLGTGIAAFAVRRHRCASAAACCPLADKPRPRGRSR